MSSPPQPGQGGWGHHPAEGHQPLGGAPTDGPQQPLWYGNQHTGWGQPGLPAQQLPQQPGEAPGGAPGTWGSELDDVLLPEKRSRLPLLLGGLGALVVLAGAGAALFFVFSGPGDPRKVAQQVVAEVNAKDFAAVRTHLCEARRTELERQLDLIATGGVGSADLPPGVDPLGSMRFDLELGKVAEQGDTAEAAISGTYSYSFTISGQPRKGSQRVDQTLGFRVEDGEWRLCELAR